MAAMAATELKSLSTLDRYPILQPPVRAATASWTEVWVAMVVGVVTPNKIFQAQS
ncbi:hypothetical protein APY04_1696 [Hyphomicrobium sulfonivorans]|uniref:Uncharacterized protein n=1 Tax=Hyphomicrobium sulfonivorans TaxID=121290 RepID=A0A120CWA2_HYPSL|nr:hypothetical protein APY04_1696 [Hyphomicrobium sulfonivorans]